MYLLKTALPMLILSLFISKQLHASDDLFSLSLSELMQMEVSGASYSGDTLSSAPASVTIFTAKEIQQLGFRYLHELANFVPGFQSKRQGDGVHAYGYFTRGRQSGTSSRSVKLIVNGQAWTTSYLESSVTSSTLLPLFNVSKVEFVRGPGSVLHGSGAMMASINVETYQNDQYVDVSLGDWESLSNAINISNNGWIFALQQSSSAGESYQLKNMDTGEYIPGKDEFTSSHFYASKAQGDFKVAFSHHLTEPTGFYSLSRVNENFNSRKNRYITLAADYSLFRNSNQEVNLHVFSNRLSNNYKSDVTGIGAFSPITNPAVNEKSWIDLDVKANQHGIKLVGDWLQLNGSLTLGAEYIYDEPAESLAVSNFDYEALTNQEYPIGYSSSDPFEFEIFTRKENHKFSAFTELEYRLSNQVNSIYSLRYDYANRVDKSSVSPRLAFIYTPTNTATLKLLYSEAFRTPGPAELGTKNNPSLIGNPDLSPEKIKTTEAIILLHKKNYSFSAAYFYNHIEDGIEQVSFNGFRQFLNTDNTYNDGLEVEYKLQITDSIKFNLAYSQQFQTLDESFRLSERYGSGALFWQHEKWIGSISSYYHSYSKLKFEDDFKILPSFWHHNTSITYLHSSTLESRISISNLSDRQYETPDESSNLDVGIPAHGRFTSYTIKIKF